MKMKEKSKKSCTKNKIATHCVAEKDSWEGDDVRLLKAFDGRLEFRPTKQREASGDVDDKRNYVEKKTNSRIAESGRVAAHNKQLALFLPLTGLIKDRELRFFRSLICWSVCALL